MKTGRRWGNPRGALVFFPKVRYNIGEFAVQGGRSVDVPVYHLDKVVKVRKEDMEDFDGPLDLILHLLSKNKMEIRDIPIALLLDQYLEWMEQRERLNLEVASEFVIMAAHLVYIKTRMLLSIDDEEALSEMEQLMAALEEHQNRESYERIKGITQVLAGRYAYGRDYLTGQPQPLPQDQTYRYQHQPQDLTAAMQRIFQRGEGAAAPPTRAFRGIVGREPYPVETKARWILDQLTTLGVTHFRALFQGSKSRSEIVATFLAVLELCKSNRIYLAGTSEDSTLTCTRPQGEGPQDSEDGGSQTWN